MSNSTDWLSIFPIITNCVTSWIFSELKHQADDFQIRRSIQLPSVRQEAAGRPDTQSASVLHPLVLSGYSNSIPIVVSNEPPLSLSALSSYPHTHMVHGEIWLDFNGQKTKWRMFKWRNRDNEESVKENYDPTHHSYSRFWPSAKRLQYCDHESG